MLEVFQYDFMLNAIAASFLASVACGIVGTYIIVKRIVFISGGIAHTAYGGIGLGYLLSFNPLLGAVGFSLAAAGFISYMRTNEKQHEDILIGVMWALGMALGIIFISLTPGYVPDLMSYLFGNILAVSSFDLQLMLIMNFIILSSVIFLFKEFQAITFDEEFAKTTGIPVDRIYLLLFCIIAITIVLLIKLVGIILAIALLTIPSAIAYSYAKSLKTMMLTSSALCLTFMLVGLLLSYYLNLPSGSTIIIVAVIGYLISFTIKRLVLND